MIDRLRLTKDLRMVRNFKFPKITMRLEILHKPRKRQDQNDKAHGFMVCQTRVIRTLPGIIPICFYNAELVR